MSGAIRPWDDPALTELNRRTVMADPPNPDPEPGKFAVVTGAS